jgi:glycine hydroxymethyltransferase
MVDMAHYSGLIAAGVYPNPCHTLTWSPRTTHKSLRGPRGGIILMKAEHEKAINSAIFPGLQGGPLMHVIAGKAVAFKEAMAPDFKAYQAQVIKNAQIMAETLTPTRPAHRQRRHPKPRDAGRPARQGHHRQSGRSATGQRPHDDATRTPSRTTLKSHVTSGMRLGTPAMTTRGFKEEETRATAHSDCRRAGQPARPEANIAAVRAKVHALTSRFPVYG